MQILKPFIWMFETENFWKRIVQLLAVQILFYLLACVFNYLGKFQDISYVLKIVFYILTILSLVLPWLILQGYFWNLTYNVISRDVDIKANSVYSGRVKNVFTIHLPEFKLATFLWRGFASVIATIIMIFPYAMLVYSTIFTESFTMPWDNIDSYHKLYSASYNLLYLFFFAFMPALLWNYAKQNSVFAVWNVPKAVYIIENYFFRYIWNTILFVLFYLLNFFVLYQIYQQFGNIVYLAAGILYLYSLHVYAYLLGTLTPLND